MQSEYVFFFINIFLVSQRAAKVAGFLCEKPQRVLDLFFSSGETPVFCVGGVFFQIKRDEVTCRYPVVLR